MKQETRKLGSFFIPLERKPEGCATRAITLTDDRPDWLLEAIQEAHCSDLPRDWIYQECEAACDAIDNGSLDEDSVHEHADSRVDVYTQARYDWAADMCGTSTFSEAESTLDDLGRTGVDTTELLGQLQYCACERIARVILDAYETSKLEQEEAS